MKPDILAENLEKKKQCLSAAHKLTDSYKYKSTHQLYVQQHAHNTHNFETTLTFACKHAGSSHDPHPRARKTTAAAATACIIRNALATAHRTVQASRAHELVVMPVARLENHAAIVVELRVRPCEVSPEVEGVEAGGLAAGREFRHYLEGVVKQRDRGVTCL